MITTQGVEETIAQLRGLAAICRRNAKRFPAIATKAETARAETYDQAAAIVQRNLLERAAQTATPEPSAASDILDEIRQEMQAWADKLSRIRISTKHEEGM